EKFQNIRGFDTERSSKIDGGIERGFGDSDLCIYSGHAALGGGNVRSPLEQLRWQTRRCGRRLESKRVQGQCELGRRLTDQYCDGVFVLRTEDLRFGGLRPRGFKLRLRLCDVYLRCDALIETVRGQIQRHLVGGDGGIENLPLCVETLDLKI